MEEKESRLVLGIDEAGRGPVVGPLVIVGYLIKESDVPKLRELGVKDSKVLTPAQREQLREKLEGVAEDYKVVVVDPPEIDAAVEGEGSNLNWLEADKAVQIMNELQPDVVVMDCPSPNTKRYKEYMMERLVDQKAELVCVHHADRDFPVVGAASILAKCRRDEEVRKIEEKVGQSVGSGYPANPHCQKFLKENWERYPELFRHSWVSFKNHSRLKAQKKLGEF